MKGSTRAKAIDETVERGVLPPNDASSLRHEGMKKSSLRASYSGKTPKVAHDMQMNRKQTMPKMMKNKTINMKGDTPTACMMRSLAY